MEGKHRAKGPAACIFDVAQPRRDAMGRRGGAAPIRNFEDRIIRRRRDACPLLHSPLAFHPFGDLIGRGIVGEAGRRRCDRCILQPMLDHRRAAPLADRERPARIGMTRNTLHPWVIRSHSHAIEEGGMKPRHGDCRDRAENQADKDAQRPPFHTRSVPRPFICSGPARSDFARALTPTLSSRERESVHARIPRSLALRAVQRVSLPARTTRWGVFLMQSRGHPGRSISWLG